MTAEDESSEGAAADDWDAPPESLRPSTPSDAPARPSQPPAPEELPAGTVVGGRYEVLRVLGKGGFGVVYDARHVELETPVALKVLRRQLTEDRRLFSRFQQEARSSAAIGHPNIVHVFDLGADEHGAYIAMEKLEGEELADRIERAHPLPEALVARIGAEVADAMQAAHEHGVIHRDLKPQNVFLAKIGRREDVAKVIDFGIAKLLHRVEGDLTKTGQLFGTPRFMAPEQLKGAKNVDARVDVYAIGALMYRALTGAYPYDGETYPELLLQIMADTPPPIARFRPDVTDRMVEIIDMAMAKRPEDRFATAAELAEALHAHAQEAPTTAPTELPEVVDRRPLRSGAVEAGIDTGPLEGAEHPPPASNRSAAIIGAAAFAVGLAGLLGVAYLGGVLDEPVNESPLSIESSAPVVEAASPEPAEPADTETETETEAQAAPEPVTLHVESDPPGAEIRVSGALVCTAPCDATVPELPVLLTAGLDGYETTERYVQAPPSTSVRVVLPRRDRDRPPRPPRPPPADPAPTGPAPPPLDPR